MLEVTQEDRDAAAKFMGDAWHLFFPDDFDQAMKMTKEVKAGGCDNWTLVQAFAAHREAAERAVVEWLQSLADAPGLPAFGFKPHDLQGIYANGFADAIAAGQHRKETAGE